MKLVGATPPRYTEHVTASYRDRNPGKLALAIIERCVPLDSVYRQRFNDYSVHILSFITS